MEAESATHNYTWLCPTQADRDRLLATVSMTGWGRVGIYVLLLVMAVVAAPTYGPLVVAMALLSGVGSALLYRNLETRRKPEYWAATAWMLTQAPLAVVIVVTGGRASPATALLACGTVSLVARFSRRGIVLGTVFLVTLLLASTTPLDPVRSMAPVWYIAFAGVLILSVETFVIGMMRSDVAGRTHDRLTGLANESHFSDGLHEAIMHRGDLAVAVLAIDIDGFGLINDGVGVANGDVLLRHVAQRIVDAIRHDAELIARRSGDEFLVLVRARVETAENEDAARQLAESVALNVQKTLDAPFELTAGTDCILTASIGIGLLGRDDLQTNPDQLAERLLSRAQNALSEARLCAPRGLCCYVSDRGDSRARVTLLSDLRKAIERGDELALHYQPTVNLHTGELLGVEALLRWNHPTRGMVMPLEFIELAEQTGLIEPIGEWVIAEACRQAREWERLGHDIDVAFNVSPRQLRHAEFLPRMLAAFAKSSVDPARMIVEITESSALDAPDRVIPLLRQIRDRGVRIALDDFGVGLSSLSRLGEVPAEILKIDRSFIADLSTSTQNGAIVRAIIQLAENLHMTPHAEGIEDERQRQFLLANGCDQGQGFMFARPLLAAEIPAFAEAKMPIVGVYAHLQARGRRVTPAPLGT